MRKAFLACSVLVAFGSIARAEAPCGDRPRQPVPSYARPGTIRFARWDGGSIMAKGCILSFYPPWVNGDRQTIEATSRWYDPSTIELARMGNLNWVYATWSWGWSIPTERPQWRELAQYITECHRHNIQVMAYMSGASMYWADMFAHHPESRDWLLIRNGNPVPYGAGLYPKDRGWYVSRYMADISKPAWVDFMKLRIAAAVEAGADAVYLDNLFPDQPVEPFVQELLRFGRSLKPDFLLAINANAGLYTAARSSNFVSTEDGTEPGYFDGRLVNNIGLLHTQWALSDGWKPVAVEYGGRRNNGDRFLVPIRAAGQQLSAAEAAAHGVAFEFYSLGAFQRDLYFRRPEALANLAALGLYNRFLQSHEELYTDTVSVAPVAVIKDDRNWRDRTATLPELASDIQYLNALAAERILYDVHYLKTLTETDLRPYPFAVLFSADRMSDGAARILTDYVRAGGTLLATKDASAFDEDGRERPDFALRELYGFGRAARPASKLERTAGKGRLVYFPAYPPVAELVAELRRLGLRAPVEIEAPKPVLYNVRRKGGRTIVHLLNYDDDRSYPVTLRWQAGAPSSVRLESPDGEAKVTVSGGDVQVSAVKRYTVLVAEGSPPPATRCF